MHEDVRPFLPYGSQSIEDDDIAAVVAALKSDFLTTGPRVGEFECAFADTVSAPHACACNSGTAALHLAMLALDVSSNDTVIVASLTFLASANAARYQGARVVFADVDERTGLMTPTSLEAAFERAGGAVKAIVVVHLNGQSADMENIARIARARGAAIVEDACHSLGAVQIGSDGERYRIGSCEYSDLCCFSFHPVKGITTAEGGMVTTRSSDLAERMARFRNHGMTRDPGAFQNRQLAHGADGSPHPWYYELPELGWNYRLPDVLCALGISQLGKLSRFVERRNELALAYDARLVQLDSRVSAHGRVDWSSHAYHLYAVLIDYEALQTTRDRVVARLKSRGVGTQVHYLPVHMQPYYREHCGPVSLAGAERYYAQCLSLPIFPRMNDGDVERVIDALQGSLGPGGE